ncbi:MAG: hypothetical protein AB8B63_03325 [Granulosicoccus sp.]
MNHKINACVAAPAIILSAPASTQNLRVMGNLLQLASFRRT